jgi:hypothetical protein
MTAGWPNVKHPFFNHKFKSASLQSGWTCLSGIPTMITLSLICSDFIMQTCRGEPFPMIWLLQLHSMRTGRPITPPLLPTYGSLRKQSALLARVSGASARTPHYPFLGLVPIQFLGFWTKRPDPNFRRNHRTPTSVCVDTSRPC